MPSPFPGMDPWLEAPGVFPGIHDSLIVYLREALNACLPDGYVATHSHLVWTDEVQRREPDVGTYGPADRPDGDPPTGPFAAAGMTTLAADPTLEPREEPYLEIRTADDERLVTAIEILSLSNKTSGANGRKAYLDKREEFRQGGVHMAEIDLLRDGTHTTAVPLARLRRTVGEFDFHYCVSTFGPHPRHHVRGFRLADRLPAIVIPLDRGVSPVTVELQPLLDRAYDTSRFARRGRYAQPADPPLAPNQQVWADGLLRANGLLPEPADRMV